MIQFNNSQMEKASVQEDKESSLLEEESVEEDIASTESDSKTGISDKLISLNLLDRKNIKMIKADFKKRKEGLLKHEFINVMLHHLPEQKDLVSLVASLNDLFAEIDVNDDQHLEWDEFTDYVIASGLVKKDQGFLEIIKSYTMAEWKDPKKHDSDIESLFFIPEVKQILVMEKDSKKFKVYNSKSMKFEREARGHKGTVLSALYLKTYNLVCTSSNDMFIFMWDPVQYLIRQKVRSKTIPLCMAEYDKRLYIGGPEGEMYFWNLFDVVERDKKKPHQFPYENCKEREHKESVSAMLAIPKINVLATGDMAGQLILWNMPSHTIKRKMNELSKGIHSLDWNEDMGCIFSAGLDRSAYVWNPYVSRFIYKISEHNHSLVSIKCVPNTHQMVTADLTGMFKVWDVRTYTVIQSFNAPLNDLNCFCVTYPDKKILAGGKVLFQYRYEEPKDQNQVDEGLPLCCLYNPQYGSFITAHPLCIKHWDAETGRLTKVFREVCDGDITAVTLDNRMRKLYVGDSEGNVISIKVKNGALIKTFEPHADEISSLYYWPDCKFLISSSRDRRVRVHDDSKSTDTGLVRFDGIEHKDVVTGIDLHAPRSFVGSCSDDATVLITNLSTLRPEVEYDAHEAEVKAIKFLAPEPLLVATDLAGFIYLWGIPQSSVKNQMILKYKNMVLPDTGSEPVETVIKSLNYDSKKRLLFTGDEKGHLKIWDISLICNKISPAGRRGLNREDDSSMYLTAVTSGFEPANVSESELVLVQDEQAHNESIVSITLIDYLSMFITNGFDLRTHIWNYNMERIGTLIVGGDLTWNVRIDMSAHNDNIKKEAYSLLEESMSMTYEEMISQMDQDVEISNSESDSDDSEDFLFSSKMEAIKANPIVKAKPKETSERDKLDESIMERKAALQRLMGTKKPPSYKSQRSSRNKIFTGAAKSMVSNR